MRKKTMLRLMILALAAILLLSGTVLAVEPTYTITIDNATQDYTYAAYQVFSGDLSGNVLSNVEWGSGVNGSALLDALQRDETISSYFAACTTAADVAEVLATSKTGDTSNFANDSANLDAFAAIVDSHLTTSSGECSYAEGKYTISNLSAGYYFVKNTGVPDGGAHTKFMLNLIKSVTITPKADVPAVEKKVEEDDKYTSDGGYGTGYNDVADWNIGDHVPFKLIGTVPKMDGYETYTYTFHDTLSTGLTLDTDSVEVYLAEAKNAVLSDLTPIETSAYSLETSPAESDCSFEISFSNLKNLSSIDATKTQYLIVTYTATLNSDAVIGLDGNPNEVYLTFSNNPNGDGTGTTPEDSVIVFTYELDTTKVDGANEETKLQNAEFVLLNSTGDQVAKVDASKHQFEGWVSLPTGTGTDGAITYQDWTTYNATHHVILSSDNQGLFKVIGLDDGTYKLREIKAPDGYNLLSADVAVVITATTANNQNWGGTASNALTALAVTANEEPGTADNDATKGIASITIANNKGSTLPETGGMGTTIFYIVGGLLVVGAAVLLITKKRMSQKS